jgi:hypothetical protein
MPATTLGAGLGAVRGGWAFIVNAVKAITQREEASFNVMAMHSGGTRKLNLFLR